MKDCTMCSGKKGGRREICNVLRLIFTIACVFLLTSGIYVHGAETPEIIAGPYLQHTTRTSMTIMWETDKPCVSTVHFGKARLLLRTKKNEPPPSVPLDQQLASKEPVAIHEFVLKNLEPQTNYFYQVRSRDPDGKEVQSEVLSFQTAVREDSAFAFVVFGDNRTFPERFATLVDRIWGERPNFVLNVGDVVTKGQMKQQWIDEYLAPASKLIQRVPIYVAIGNHERNADWFYKYVSYPNPENYYSFEYGNAHFTIVDSNSDLSPESDQYKWLIKDLALSKARWKFVAHHHPPFTSDENKYGDTYRGLSQLGDPKVAHLVPVYEQYHVDVVWYGHTHSYERTWPIKDGRIDQKEGVVYIQSGGGGAPLKNFAPTRSWFTAKLLYNWQYCLVNIHDNTFRMMAYDIEGRLYDFLELRK